MLISRTASLTRNWFALSAALGVTVAGACSSPRSAADSDSVGIIVERSQNVGERNVKRDSLSGICQAMTQRGSIQVARVDAKVDEGGVAFDLLGDGAGEGVIACGDTLYADVHALMDLMADSSKVTNNSGIAVVDGTVTKARAGYYKGVLYVRVDSFARNRRALLLANPGQPTAVVVWPRKTLLHLRASGLTAGRAYKTAVTEGLLP